MRIFFNRFRRFFVLLLLLALSTFYLQAQNPFVYYQFEGDTTFLNPSANSTCSYCKLISLPTNCTPIDTGSYVQVGQYLDFQLTNGQVKIQGMSANSHITVPTCSAITINVLINLDPIFELQRLNVLFNLVDTGNKTIATAYIDYATIGFDTKNGTGIPNHYFIRLKNIGPQSWDYYVNPTRNANWHL